MSESNENRRNESSSDRRPQSETSTPAEESGQSSSSAGTEDSVKKSTGNRKSVREVPFSQKQWENLASDPDIHTDLGYRATDWEIIETLDNSSQLIFMPEDEELLKDDAFIVADENVTCDLGEYY